MAIMADIFPETPRHCSPNTNPNKLDTYLVTNNSNELSDVLFHCKMTREKEKVGYMHGQSVSLEKEHGRRRPAHHVLDRSEWAHKHTNEYS